MRFLKLLHTRFTILFLREGLRRCLLQLCGSAMTDSASSMRLQQNSLGVSGQSVCSECTASRRPARNPPKTARQTPHASQKRQSQKFLRLTGTRRAQRRRSSKDTSHGEDGGEGGALHPRRRRRNNTTKGDRKLKNTRRRSTVLARHARLRPHHLEVRLPVVRPGHADLRRPGEGARRARRVVGPRPKVWFLRAFAAGAV